MPKRTPAAAPLITPATPPRRSCDLQRRPAFEAVLAAFRTHGARLEGWDAPMQNVRFIEGRFDSAEVRSQLDARTYVVALHACTEANGAAIEMAEAAGAMWAVMPCCMRNVACLPDGCQLMRTPDATRHAVLCGALVQRYDADLVVAVDRRVTNRNLVICGGPGRITTRSNAPVLFNMPGKSRKNKSGDAPRYADYYAVHAAA